jgi:MerR family transcriptional regulator, copper efflux regulator
VAGSAAMQLLHRLSCAAMNASSPLSIGVLARQTGCTVPTIRYYEQIGLLPAGPRTEGGRRVYGDATVRRLTFIRRCRDFGFSIEQVRDLVGLVDEPDRPCLEVRNVAATHLAQLREKLAELQALERSMSAFVCSCDEACAGGPAVDCTILENLASPDRAAAALPSVPAVNAVASSCCR